MSEITNMDLNENTYSECCRIADEIMFKIIRIHSEFTADTFYECARSNNMPPAIIKKLAGSVFKQFQAAGYIQKTDRYRLSQRNQSTPLPVWIKAEESN
jgi:hypothetical protein